MKPLSLHYNQNFVRLWTNWRTLLRIAFVKGYIWQGCELYLHGSNIKIGNADKKSDLSRGIIFNLLHRRNYFRSFLLGSATVQQRIIFRWMYSILLGPKKLIICPHKFLTILPVTAGESVNNNE